MFYLFILIYFSYRCLSIDKDCRILQLNHYQIERSFTFLKHSCQLTYQRIMKAMYHFPFLFLLFAQENQFELYILMLIVYFYLNYKSRQTLHRNISLKFTKRIIRLYLCIFIIYIILLSVFYQYSFFLILSLFLMMSNTFIVFIASLIMYPIEKTIRNFYVVLAKRTLFNNPYLIKIGIVGSYGKTSTKNIIYHLLSEKYYCLKSQKSYNNLMGNTLTIRKELKNVHEVLIAEMGSDHVGEIKKLMNFIQPTYMILTSIGNQHLETFKSQENIVREKISPMIYMKRNDIIFINIDNPYLYENRNLGVVQKIYFGERNEANYRLEDVSLREWGSSFKICYKEVQYPFETKLLGYYNIMNICGSIAMAHTLGVKFEEIRTVIANLKPIEHRLQSIQKKNYTLIDNAYNSNVVSFKNSLQVLSKIDKYCILITPGLIDLKIDSEINNQLMDKVGGCVDEIVIVGYKNRAALCEGLQRNRFENYQIMDTMEEALHYVDNLGKKDYVVLIENDIDKDLMNA